MAIMSETTQHRPFHCGTQLAEWEEQCYSCTKGFVDNETPGTCPITVAINEAYWGDGTVSEEIAERMGYLDHSPPRQKGFSYVWNCKEFVRKEQA